MKLKLTFFYIVTLIGFINIQAQENNNSQVNEELLGLPGDNLNLYATLDLFQKSKTIEDFEAALNKEETGINNLDLNLDGKVDFIKVTTKQEKDDFTFILQVDVKDKEIQDVAVILVSKDKKDKVSLKMVGDEALYGKDYVIEPKAEVPSVTANPAYTGSDAVEKNEEATVVVVESQPIVRYIYSPVYVPYYSPFYWGFYPPYFRPFPVISINIYFGRHRYYPNRYYGGHRGGGNTVIINNNTYNNYSRTRNTSNTVINNKREGNYKKNNLSQRSQSNTAKNTRAKNNNAKSLPNNKSKAKQKYNSSSNPSKPNTKQNIKSPINTKKIPSTRPKVTPRRGGGRIGGRG